MKVGAMNHPASRPEDEIRWMAEMGLDFVDLTLEPPGAAPWQIDVPSVRKVLQESGLGVVGHTAYYLPLGHVFEEVRKGAVAAFRSCIEIFAELGAPHMNIHPDFNCPMHDRKFCVGRNLETLHELLETSRRTGVGLMVENAPGSLNTAHQLADFLDEIPEVGLHLDLGHCNLMVHENTTESILAAYGDRLSHVHLHDNKGGNADLHLPLGTGTVNVDSCIRALKRCGYDGTITLEVFSPDREYLRYSIDKLRRMWREL